MNLLSLKSYFFVSLIATNAFALKYTEWSPNLEFTSKSMEKNIEQEKLSQKASYKGKEVSLSRQLIDGTPVYTSFIKKISVNGKNELLQTNTTDKKIPLTESAVKVKKIDYLSEIKKKGEGNLRKVEIISEEQNLIEEGGKLLTYTLVSYFDAYGTPYTAFFKADGNLTKTQRQGSQLAETHAMVYTESPKVNPPSDILIENLQITPAITNEKIFVTSDSDKKITQISENLKFDSKDDRFDQIQVFYYLNKAAEWMKTNLEVSIPNQLQAVVYIGYPEKTNSAFYFQNKIRFGKGDDVVYSNITHDPTIVYHEYFHSMIDNLAQLSFEGEGGSLNEAFADFFTCLMSDKPNLAEASYLKGPFKRSLTTSYKLEEATGGLYHDSLIFSGLLWEIKEKMGTDKAKYLAMETLIKLNNLSKFSDFNKKILEVAQAGLSKEELLTFQQILKSRGFKYE